MTKIFPETPRLAIERETTNHNLQVRTTNFSLSLSVHQVFLSLCTPSIYLSVSRMRAKIWTREILARKIRKTCAGYVANFISLNKWAPLEKCDSEIGVGAVLDEN